MILDLCALRAEADRWLLAQPADRALDPSAVAYFRRRFCLPSWLVEIIRRDADRERDRDVDA